MNAEFLHEVAVEVLAELDRLAILEKLERLAGAATQMAANPAEVSIAEDFANTRRGLIEDLTHESMDFAPLWQQALSDMGAWDLLGIRLANAIDEIVTRNQVTPALIAPEVVSLRSDLLKFQDLFERVHQGMEGLGIGTASLEPGAAEVAILIPRLAVSNTVTELADEFRSLTLVLNPFNEVVLGNRPPLEVHEIASSDFTLFVRFAPHVAAVIADTLFKLLLAYDVILRIRQNRDQLRNSGVSEDVLSHLAGEENRIFEQKLDEIEVAVINDSVVVNEGRRQELHTEVRLSLRGLADRLDRGFVFDVRGGPETEPGEEDGDDELARGVNEALETIKSLRPRILQVRLEGAPVLELASGDRAGGAADDGTGASSEPFNGPTATT